MSLRLQLGLIFVLASMVVWAAPATAQETETPAPDSLTVSGTGTVYAAPDVAYIELGVNSTDPSLSTAFSQTGQAISKVLQALKALGIADEDIQTSGISVSPQDQYDQQGNASTQRVYQVSNTVQVTVRKVDQVEAVLTAAVEAGANTIYNLSFGIQNSDALEQQARSQAVANAQSRAQQLASALGVTLGRPMIVIEVPQDAGGPVPVFGRNAVALAASSASQPVNQGQLSVTVQVQITYSIG